MALFMELGPCTLHDDGSSNITTKINPNSWNEKANVFFVRSSFAIS